MTVLSAGSLFDDNFEIIQHLGSGSMGTVYKCWQSALRRHVSLKFLAPEFTDEAFLERFKREGKALSLLHHPNIVAFYCFGVSDGRPYFAMEYVEGVCLSDMLKTGPVADLSTFKSVAMQLCLGLQYIHEAGIIHRDIKPANIMVEVGGRVRLLDFGLARITSDTLITQEGMTLGTVSFMSPEACCGRHGDPRSDIYALGCVLYACMTGSVPFHGLDDDLPSLMYRKLHSEPAPITEHPAISSVNLAAIQSVILRCMMKQPDLRYRSALEVLQAIEESCEPTPAIAKASGHQAKRAALIPLAVVLASLIVVAVLATQSGARKVAEVGINDNGGTSARLVPLPPEKSWPQNNQSVIPRSMLAQYLNLVQNSRLQLAEHHYSEAESLSMQAIRLSPRCNLAYESRAQVVSRQDDAILSIDKAIELVPTSVTAHYMRSNFFRDRRKFTLAMSDINLAIYLQPRNAALYSSRALIFEGLQDLRSAAKDRAIVASLAKMTTR